MNFKNSSALLCLALASVGSLLGNFESISNAQGATTPVLSLPGRTKPASPNRPAPPDVAPLGPAWGTGFNHWTLTQPPLSASAVDQLKRGSARDGRLQIGVGRSFEQPLVVTSNTTPAASWTLLPNGWHIWSVDVFSPGAVGIRLHLDALVLPSGAQLVVYDPANPSTHSEPVTVQTIAGRREYWVGTVLAEHIALECQVPPEVDPGTVAFTLARLSHLYQLPVPTASNYKAAGSCENDVSCFPAYASEADAVARMAFVQGGSTFVCSGALLADNNPTSSVDYFLTANHCLSSQAVASTAEFWWLYQTRSCNGTPPSLSGVPHTTGGADLLAASSVNDFSFVQLRQSAPSGASFLGWTVNLPSTSETLACIHHPSGDYTRISFGNETGTDGNFWAVRWSSGVTENGSSGSPLLDASHLVIGQLSAGVSSCSNPSGIDTFGRFDVTFNSVAQFLSGGTGTNFSPLVKGTYNGLFSDSTNGVALNSAGSVTLTLSSKAKFTGHLVLGPTRYSFNGQFDDTGSATVNLNPRNAPALTLQLQVNPGDSDNITGTVAGDTWTAQLSANRAVFDGRKNVADATGRYTLVFPGDPTATDQPNGDSYGTVNVSKSGRISLSGTLADGTKISQSTTVSKADLWPLYLPLYKGQGLLFSWLSFANTDTADISGGVSWIKPPISSAKFYPGGFSANPAAIGSSYVRPAKGATILNMDTGSIAFSGGALSQDFTNNITLGANNKALNQSQNKMTLNFSLGSGLFSGRVTDPNSGTSFPFNGAVLQKSNMGSGSFLGFNLSGEVVVGP